MLDGLMLHIEINIPFLRFFFVGQSTPEEEKNLLFLLYNIFELGRRPID